MEESYLSLIGIVIAFIAGVFITRAIFSIPKFIRYQRAQVHLLSEIALKQGVPKEVISMINIHNEIDTRPKTNEEMRVELASKR